MEPPFKVLFEAHAFMERTDRQTDRPTDRRAIMFQGARLGPDGHQTRAIMIVTSRKEGRSTRKLLVL